MQIIVTKKAKVFLFLAIVCLIIQRIIEVNTNDLFWQYVSIAIVLLGLFFAMLTWHFQKPLQSKKDIIIVIMILGAALLFLVFPYLE